ncbi:hypothetical protein PAESOLCIP111_03711 [Paenibacillus solanacearum]|uniref:Uncharacterized protein n=1 Tax=Paenibacillus solanacearum TaxID=2048548 RepID=A0A916NQH3_9BACL|nr:hypothetical protein [Paenibacillus solanacearum]CAG7635847.1 hypothetical protein PAESOLCIP111_03711 [Paenibacillus solanacearum]
MTTSNKIEKLLWAIALPGFGQFLNKQYVKGITLIILEFVINTQAHLNLLIIYSFQGDIDGAIQVTDYHWLMFYPCLYMFGMWDAYKDAGTTAPFAYLPFVLGAFFGTVGIMFSTKLKLFGVLFGPVWLPMLFAFIGIFTGIVFFLMIRRVVR